MKKLTRARVVPIISASVSWLIVAKIGSGRPSLPKFAPQQRTLQFDRLSQRPFARTGPGTLELQTFTDHYTISDGNQRRDSRHRRLREPRSLAAPRLQHCCVD